MHAENSTRPVHADQAAINTHMPVDHMMGATVEGKESATAPQAAAEKVGITLQKVVQA